MSVVYRDLLHRLSMMADRVAELEALMLGAWHALERLEDHHCSGICAEDQEARGYDPHSKVMAEVAAAGAAVREYIARQTEPKAR